MNLYQLSGAIIFLNGIIQEAIGRFLGAQHMELHGHARKIVGKSKMAIGDAQRIIQRYIKRRERKIPQFPM